MAEDQAGLTNDDFRAPEEIEAQKQLSNLVDVAHEGALWSDWAQQTCSKKLVRWLDDQIVGAKTDWLAASEEEARAIRFRTQSYRMIKSWIASHIQAGNVAAIGVKKLHDEGVTLEGLIKTPPPAK